MNQYACGIMSCCSNTFGGDCIRPCTKSCHATECVQFIALNDINWNEERICMQNDFGVCSMVCYRGVRGVGMGVGNGVVACCLVGALYGLLESVGDAM